MTNDFVLFFHWSLQIQVVGKRTDRAESLLRHRTSNTLKRETPSSWVVRWNAGVRPLRVTGASQAQFGPIPPLDFRTSLCAGARVRRGFSVGAGRGSRTPKTRRSADFESAASASSAIPAREDYSF